ncbi:serine hydrolase domain-containing protein [Wenzhouxiangella marina]|nr:serine hydrolase domain-containing protein [Wenzhouxiangella marina]MBB6087966.1 CubicO group peptidase (beta-lactamase class C family) [Wenzhouxiangella marina]
MNKQGLLATALCASLIVLTPTATDASCNVLQFDRFEPVVAEDISRALTEVRSEHGLPAVGAVLVDSNGVIAYGADGLRLSDGSAEVDLDELWHLGSNTKAMTATLYATFVRDGELSFDDPLPSFFPEIAALPVWQSVTIRHLLRHQGGVVPNLPQMPGSDPADVMAFRAQWAEDVLTAEPASAVGSVSYSNVGIVLVGAAMEAHTGQPWEALMSQRLFGPLGMNQCGFGPPPHPGNAQGHGQDGTPLPGADNTPMLGPAGTVHCSLESWGRYLSANLAGPKGESPLLGASLWNELHDSASGAAMGWFSSGWYNRPGIWHNGSNGMWYSQAWIIPGTDRVYGVATNIANGNGANAAAIRLTEATSVPLGANEPYAFGGCSDGNEEQMYCLNLDAESAIDLSISHEPFGGLLILEHYNEDGTGLGQTVGNDSGVSLNTTLPAGRYVFRVVPNNFMPACPPYEVLVTTPP